MEFTYKEITFTSDGNRLKGYLSYPSSQKSLPGVLFIHGGGKYTENLYVKWQEYLCKNGYASFSFYCRGVGTSEGKFEQASLENRLIDSIAAYNVFIESGVVDKNRICAYGSSMGAHIAIRLANQLPDIKTLILQSAAAYSLKAEKLPLNNKFSEEIRKNHTWQEFPIFTSLKNFKGAVLVVYGEKDTIIPDDIKNEFRKSVVNGKYITLKGGLHTLLRPKIKPEEEARDQLFEQSVDFLDVNL